MFTNLFEGSTLSNKGDDSAEKRIIGILDKSNKLCQETSGRRKYNWNFVDRLYLCHELDQNTGATVIYRKQTGEN